MLNSTVAFHRLERTAGIRLISGCRNVGKDKNKLVLTSKFRLFMLIR